MHQPALVSFADGSVDFASCLGCPDAPCVYFAEEEIRVSAFSDFPAADVREVCASGAIRIIAGIPVVQADTCFSCGICVARCPTGAMAMLPEKGPTINEAKLIQGEIAHSDTRRALNEATKSECVLLEESHGAVLRVLERIATLDRLYPDTFRNLLVRNLLIHTGGAASTRRKGINAVRMDIVAMLKESPAVAVVEFGQEAILNAPRGILDALAVLVARYGWSREQSGALIVTDVLPNRRSDYWSLIEDINNVLKIRIRTLSLLALLLAVWNNKKLSLEGSALFCVDRSMKDYATDVLEPFIGRKLLCRDARSSSITVMK